MYIYLIAYSSAKALLDHGKNIGLDFANQLFKQFENYPVENKIDYPTSFREVLVTYLDEEIDYDDATKSLLNEVVNLLRQEDSIDWDAATGNLGRNEVFRIVDELKDEIKDKDYWMLIGFCYTVSDFCYNDYETLKKYLNTNRVNKEHIMNEEDRSFLNSLPDQIKVFRGCSKKEIKNGVFRFSWTLDREIAYFFAYKYRRNSNIDCDIVEQIIDKKDVLAYFNDRNEQEILLVPQ